MVCAVVALVFCGTCVAVGALHTSDAFGCARQSVLHAVSSRRVTGPVLPRTAPENSRPSLDSGFPVPLLESPLPLPRLESPPPMPRPESSPLPPPAPPAPLSPTLPDGLACACTSTCTSIAVGSLVAVALIVTFPAA